MYFLDFLSDYSLLTILTLSTLAFIAGFVDAVVGGGGLIQLPALLIGLPQTPIATIFGTNKLVAFAGTSVAAVQYSKRITYNFLLLFCIAVTAAFASFFGARAVSYINVNTLKPVVLIVLVVIAMYTFVKKDLGSANAKHLPISKQIVWGCFMALVIGFYDGFFGPGTGSFLVLGFVSILGFSFLQASAYAKVVNCLTNLGALIVFIKQGSFILPLAIAMAGCNMFGNIIGAKLALKKGNGFVRIIFLVVVIIMILRYGYDVLYK